MLIDATRLSQHLNDPAWVIFDCRHDLMDTQKGARVYAEGHLPGAFFAAVDTDLSGKKTGTNGRHPLPPASEFAAFLNRHGVTNETQIVAYDDVGGQYAARLWWMARWIGLKNVGVLDGGIPKWIAGGGPVTKELPAARGAGSVVARPDPGQVLGASEVNEAIISGEKLVIDARTAERYRGESEPIDKVAGRIPSAVNRFFKANLNPDLTMRPADELRREFEALMGEKSPGKIVHQCGSGITACANLLAMEHAGLGGSKLYAGSWSEWIADPARPIAKG